MRLKNKGRTPWDILTLGGRLTLTRTVLVPEGADGPVDARAVYPLDMALGLDRAPFKVTFSMVAAIAQEVLNKKTCTHAANAIEARCHDPVSDTTVKKIAHYVGALVHADDLVRAENAREAETGGWQVPTSPGRPGEVLYIAFGGPAFDAGSPVRVGFWKDCRMAAVFTSGQLHSWKGNCGKTCQALGKLAVTGLIGSEEDFRYHALALVMEGADALCTKTVVLTSGSDQVLPFALTLFPNAIHILDQACVKETASRFARAVKRRKAEKAAYARLLHGLIEKGDIQGLLKETEPYRDWEPRWGIPNFHTFVESRGQYMNYPEYEAKGYLVGNGEIEGGLRHIMREHLLPSGPHWNEQPAQGYLAMKSRYESNRWDEVVELCRQDYLDRSRSRNA